MTEQPQLTTDSKDNDPNKKKQQTEVPSAPQPPTPAQVKAEGMRKRSKEYHSKTEILENKVGALETTVRELTEHLKTHGTATSASEKTAQSAATEHVEPKPDEKLPKHYVKNWMANCPECGEKNPNFKDETACRKCGQHLGSVVTAEKLGNCPYCGSKEGAIKL